MDDDEGAAKESYDGQDQDQTQIDPATGQPLIDSAQTNDLEFIREDEQVEGLVEGLEEDTLNQGKELSNSRSKRRREKKEIVALEKIEKTDKERQACCGAGKGQKCIIF